MGLGDEVCFGDVREECGYIGGWERVVWALC